MGYDYIMRFAVEPNHCEEERLDNLVEFCKAGNISEVMFFISCEELNSGHPTLEEVDKWLCVIEKGRDRLNKIGVATSLNPWATILHCDRGRSLKEGQNFRRMTDIKGYTASAVACPNDEKFISYLCSIYQRYAEFHPRTLWVEDDFRLHNHSPLEWGGCFCDEHMKLFSSLAGKSLTRDEFLAGICSGNEVHPYRKIWLDTARETINNLSKRIGDAVFSVDPDIRIGLMTSGPATHCAEGRDWDTIMNNFTGNLRPCVRINLPSYVERTPQEYGNLYNYSSRNTKAFLPLDIETFPEIENFTDTRYIKSLSFTQFQIETTSILGSRGIAMNLFDMMGNGILMKEGYQKILQESKQFLDSVTELGLRVENQTGIKIMVDKEASYNLFPYHNQSIDGIAPKENSFSALLSLFSIATSFCTDKNIKGETIAVSSQYFRNMTKDEVTKLLHNNNVILDGEAVVTLDSLGLLELIGGKRAKIYPADAGTHAYEQVCCGRRYCGIEKARMGTQEGTGDFVAVEYTENEEIELITKAHRYDGKYLCDGIAVINKKILVIPYINYPDFWGSHKNSVLAEIVQEFLLDNTRVAFIPECPHLYLFHYIQNSKNVFIVSNFSGDSYDDFTIKLKYKLDNLKILTRNNVETRNANVINFYDKMIFQDKISRLETQVFFE